ncbi:hypothetical protein QN277_020949 [Acacia crassicarpa]|uniref:ELMO domain-containing protein n=1 Tax=Acacia crassicarpa TaxID=499986 RepID=A0AAE1JQG1_9FABA|nr:hypothetical protein QN277_020949 [Acacia crassicarpa]
MATKALRRRLHHGDIDSKVQEHLKASDNLDASSEPLLDNSKAKVSTLEDLWNDERKKEQLHWTFLYSQLITQWAQTLANGPVGSRSLISRLLSHSPNAPNRQNNRMLPRPLSPLREERLRHVQERLQVSFDDSRTEHRDSLKQLWKLAFPNRSLPALKSELWKEMGWQGEDPSTDFRYGICKQREKDRERNILSK